MGKAIIISRKTDTASETLILLHTASNNAVIDGINLQATIAYVNDIRSDTFRRFWTLNDIFRSIYS
jgi:hypothetical protein